MNKILLVIQKEYLNKVRKKSFIIMSVLSPILITALWLVPVLLATNTVSVETKNVGVVDESNMFLGKLRSNESLNIKYLSEGLDQAKNELDDGQYQAILYIPKINLDTPNNDLKLYANEEQGKGLLRQLERQVNHIIEKNRYAALGLNQKEVDLLDSRFGIQSVTLNADDEEAKLNQDVMFGLGYAMSFLVYFIIFLYGVQVMKSVTEEKSNKIVEIIISSVKPMQLMLGKIIGVSFVVFTQLLIWGVLVFVLSQIVSLFMSETNAPQAIGMIETGVQELSNYAGQFNLFSLVFFFVSFLIGGYLLYSSFFAVIGAIVNSDSDTQQYIMPVSIPLIVSLMSISYVLMSPSSSISFWLSIFPLTSPIVMVARLPFGVPISELLLAVFLLYFSFVSITWVAGKIFRIGILSQGGKPSVSTLIKWIKDK